MNLKTPLKTKFSHFIYNKFDDVLYTETHNQLNIEVLDSLVSVLESQLFRELNGRLCEQIRWNTQSDISKYLFDELYKQLLKQ
jgi:hypothetical protein